MKPEKANIYGKRLKEKRLASGKTQAEVAKELEVAESHYQRYEYGMMPSAALACKIAKSIKATVEEIWGVQG